MTEHEVADRMDMSDYYKRRSRNPALDFIERSAAALEVSVAKLLDSKPNSSKGKPGPARSSKESSSRSNSSRVKSRGSPSNSSIPFSSTSKSKRREQKKKTASEKAVKTPTLIF